MRGKKSFSVSLTTTDPIDNGIGKEGAEMISRALKINTTLTELDLSGGKERLINELNEKKRNYIII